MSGVATADRGGSEAAAAPAVWAVVPAAGQGRRTGHEVPKQYLPLAGRPVLAHTLGALAATPGLAGVVLVVSADDARWSACVPPGLDVLHVGGGQHRMHSVRNGLGALAGRAGDDDWVLVHDAARPCLPPDDLRRLMHEVADDPVGGLLARPVADTLKRAGGGDPPRVTGTVTREGLWHALTPQVFRHALLRRCLDEALAAGQLATDEAQAVEWGGHAPRLVAGSPLNLKITLANDLLLAERLLELVQ